MTNKPATFTLRLLSWFTETGIYLFIGAYLVNYISGQQTLASAFSAIIVSFTLFFLNPLIIYQPILFTYYFGGSLGKLLTGLQITDQNRNKLSGKRILFRQTVGYMFSSLLFGLGYLSIIKDPQKQAWHDKTVDSLVVTKQNLWLPSLLICLTSLALAGYAFHLSWQKLTAGPLLNEINHLKQQINADTISPELVKFANSDLSYEISFPVGWHVDKSIPSEIKFDNMQQGIWGVIYTYSMMYAGSSIQNDFQNKYNTLPGKPIKLSRQVINPIKVSNTTVDGIDAVIYTYANEQQNNHYFFRTYEFYNDIKYFQITFSSYTENDRELNTPLFDQIVNSFKLTSSSVSPILMPSIKPTDTPQSPQLIRDHKRADDLRLISDLLSDYENSHHSYPVSLKELTQSNNTVLPLDPLSKASYQYFPIFSNSNYNLCAVFETKNILCISPGNQTGINNLLP